MSRTNADERYSVMDGYLVVDEETGEETELGRSVAER